MDFISDTFSELVQRLGRQTAEQIIDDLYQHKILSLEERDTITTEKVSQVLSRNLLLMIRRKGVASCTLFVQCLEARDPALFQDLQGKCELGSAIQTEFESLAQDLKQLYKSPGFRQFHPLGDETGIDILFDLETTFTDPLLWRKDLHNRRREQLTLEDFLQELESPCIIEGEAGKGKTTLLKRIATLWARGKCKSLEKYKFVFFISLSSARSGMYETLCDQLLGLSYKWSKVIFLKELLELKDKVLFLLDGYDEFKSENCAELDGLIKDNCRYKNAVVVTTRTETIKVVRKFGSLIVETGDLTEQSAVALIKNVLFDEGADVLLSQLKDSLFMKNLMKTPLFVVIACALRMGDSTSLLNTQTALFRTLYDLMVDKNKYKTRNVATSCVVRSMAHCGDLALNGVFNHKFDFEQEDLASVKEEVLLAAGLIHKYTAQRLWPIYRFFHKSFQEYAAGRRLAELLTSANGDEATRGESYLKTIKCASEVTTKYCNLLLYTCGSSKSATRKVIRYLTDIYQQGILFGPFSERDFVECGIGLFYESSTLSDLSEEFQALFSGKSMYINTQNISAHFFDFFSYLPNCLSSLDLIKLDFFGNVADCPNSTPEGSSASATGLLACETYIPKKAVDLFFDWNQALRTLEITLKDFSKLNKKDIKYLGKICCCAARLSLHIKRSPGITNTLKQVLESCRNMQDLIVECTPLSIEDEQRVVEMSVLKTLHICNLQTERLQGGLIDRMGNLVNIEKLVLNDVRMTEEDATHLAKGIRNLKRLTVLQLSHLPAIAEGMDRIVESVTSEPCNLEEATLVSCCLSGTAVKTLAKHLCNLPNLITLDLSENHLENDGEASVEMLVDSLHVLPKVTTLMLPSGPDVGLCLDKLLMQLEHMPQLQKLSLRRWGLGDVELTKLSKLLINHLKGLLHLDLGENPAENSGWLSVIQALQNQKDIIYFDFSTVDMFKPYPSLILDLKRVIFELKSLLEIKLKKWDLDETDRKVINSGKKILQL
ncbi:NLR family CARD domain-containing protein 4 [Ambystoma mexicanum]|uniref:NLR family CARD domain-containing protein 4 n=1 Tax=Ambystoma mexicanum TaxID=8296 RepID=UPI0037E72F8A